MIKNKKILILVISIILLTVFFTLNVSAEVNDIVVGSDKYFTSDDEISITNGYVGSYNQTGVKVTLNNLAGKSNAGFTYNNYISTDDFNEDFLNISFLPENLNVNDFTHLLVTLTDAFDDSQVVVIDVSPQPAISGNWYYWTMCYVSLTEDIEEYSNLKYANAAEMRVKGTLQNIVGLNNIWAESNPYYTGTYMDSGYNIGANNVYFKKEKADSELSPLSFNINGKNCTINNGLIANLNDANFLKASSKNLEGTQYEGLYTADYVSNLFSSGYVKLKIDYVGLNSDSISCDIYKIGTQTFADNNNCEIKRTSPLIYNTFTTNGVAGYKYTLPVAICKDMIDGDLANNVVTSVYDSNNNAVTVTNNTFTPVTSENYTIIYTAINSAGDSFDKQYLIKVFGSMPKTDMLINTDYKDSYLCGDRITLPYILATNSLSLNKNSKVSILNYIQLNGKVIKVIENDGSVEYTLTDAGDYTVSFVYQNEFGITELKSYSFTVSKAIAVNVQLLPISFTAGKANTLNDFSVTNYVNASSGDNIFRAIYINDTRIYLAKGSDVIEGSLTFNTLTEAGTAVLTYKAGFLENNLLFEKEFIIPVIKPEYISDYIISYDLDGSYNNDGVTVTNSKSGITFVTDRNKGFTLPNALVAKDLKMRFGIDSTNNNFDHIDLILEDIYNSSNKLVFSIYASDDITSYLYVNNGSKAYKINGSFSNQESFYSLNYNSDSLSLVSESGIKLTDKITTNYNGSAFSGFESGLVKLSFEIYGANAENNGSLVLKTINNQSFGSIVIFNKVQKYSDIITPMILYSDDIKSSDLNIGDYLTVVPARAYDVLDTKTSINVTVLAPDGSYLLNKASCDKNYTFQINTYGSYYVTYESSDSNILFSSSEKFIFTIKDKIAPVITVNGTIESEYKLGDIITFPNAIATDNLCIDCPIYVVVIMPAGMRYVVTAPTYKFTLSGDYIIEYYTYDDNYNMAVNIFNVTIV